MPEHYATFFFGYFLIGPPPQLREKLAAMALARAPELAESLPLAAPVDLAHEILPRYYRATGAAQATLLHLPPGELSLGFSGDAIAVVQWSLAVSAQLGFFQKMPLPDLKVLMDTQQSFHAGGVATSHLGYWLLPEPRAPLLPAPLRR